MTNVKRASLLTIMLVLATLTGIVICANLMYSQGAKEREATGANRQEIAQDFRQLSEEANDEELARLYKFLASSAWHDYQATAFQFGKAHFSADTDRIKSFLLFPDSEDHHGYFPTEKRSLDDMSWFVIKGLRFYYKIDGKRIELESVSSEMEIIDARYDSSYYLCTNMIMVDGKWKVTSFGLSG
ncbi:MAG: hypothetical protein FWG14_06170 [Peptococcaceae bacterium]|nr:hypothetical protein [Peptococcaceae bacterium]